MSDDRKQQLLASSRQAYKILGIVSDDLLVIARAHKVLGQISLGEELTELAAEILGAESTLRGDASELLNINYQNTLDSVGNTLKTLVGEKENG